ncbi:MAG TPA: hypothetical protein PK014_03935 [Thermoanaerobaculia bacterium]|nr:hypothetical protein [Thermoanaerobaculia bacterium]
MNTSAGNLNMYKERCMRKNAILRSAVSTIIVFLLFPVTVLSQEHDVWKPFQFLMGKWSGTGSGKPGEAVSGITSFSYELDKNIIVRKNVARYAPKEEDSKGRVHEDLLVFYPQSGDTNVKAIYFDNEGHLIHYKVSSSDTGNHVMLDSENAESEPHFRLVYELTKDGKLSVEFFFAPPGGALTSYLKGEMKREE